MGNKLLILSLTFLLFTLNLKSQTVSTKTELAAAISNASAGTTIILSNGIWKDVQININKIGNASNPITIKAQTTGNVFFEGNSKVKMGGEYIILEGIVFRNPSNLSVSAPIVDFKSSDFCNHCTMTNVKIDSYNGTSGQSTETFKWVLLHGQYNEISYCSFIGKHGVGSIINDNRNSPDPDYTKIHHNYFGGRTPVGAVNELNDQDAIRIGNSATSLSSSYTEVYNNFFNDFHGEIEVISNKSCNNKFYNNTFKNYSGSLTLRHGNDNEVFNNYFFADNNFFSGGVRVIGENHKIYNNYIEGINSKKADGATSKATGGINVTNGRQGSALNGYFQVKNTTIVNNTFVNCDYALRIGTKVKSDLDLAPENLIVANNIMLNSSVNAYQQVTAPGGTLSKTEGNITQNGNWDLIKGVNENKTVTSGLLATGINFFRIPGGSAAISAGIGSYSFLTNDILGGTRSANFDAGAEEYGAGGANRPYNLSDIEVIVGFKGNTNQEPTEYSLTINTTGQGSVSASPSPIAGTYTDGTVITITATPSVGWGFDGWSGDATGTQNSVNVTMNANKTVTAIFSATTIYSAPYDIPKFQDAIGQCKLQAPNSSTAASQSQLTAGYTSSWFYVADTDKMAFHQSGASNRTELRYLNNWFINNGNRTAHANLKIVSQTCDQVTFIQIHDDANAGNGPNLPLLRIYKHRTKTPVNHIWAAIKTDAGGSTTQHIDLGAAPTGYFDCDVVISGGNLLIEVNGIPKVNRDVSFWTYPSYWKAGVYLQDAGEATVHFNELTWPSTSSQYTLTTNTVGQGNISLNPAGGSYASGTVVNATATAAAGYEFAGWSGAASGTTNPVTITMDANKTLTATFTAVTPTYTLTTSFVGQGTISLSPAGGLYTSGTVVNATATAAAGYEFAGWSGVASGTTNPVAITMDANKTLTATFTAVTLSYTLTTSVVGQGSVSLSPAGGSYTSGTVVTLTAQPAAGWRFNNWSGAASGTSGTASVTMNSNLSVTANFGVLSSEVILAENQTGGDKMDIKDGQEGAQSFRYGNVGGPDYQITKVVLYLSRDADAPNGNLNFSIGTNVNSNTIPGTDIIITPSQVANTSEGSSFTAYEIVYSSPAGPFKAGTTYYLNMENNSPNGKAFYIEFSGDNFYPNGTYYKSHSNEGKDARFRIWGVSASAKDTGPADSMTEMRIYPNPAKNQIVVEYNSPNTKMMEIRNITGVVVKTIQIVDGYSSVDISELKQGIYIISIPGILSKPMIFTIK